MASSPARAAGRVRGRPRAAPGRTADALNRERRTLRTPPAETGLSTLAGLSLVQSWSICAAQKHRRRFTSTVRHLLYRGGERARAKTRSRGELGSSRPDLRSENGWAGEIGPGGNENSRPHSRSIACWPGEIGPSLSSRPRSKTCRPGELGSTRPLADACSPGKLSPSRIKNCCPTSAAATPRMPGARAPVAISRVTAESCSPTSSASTLRMPVARAPVAVSRVKAESIGPFPALPILPAACSNNARFAPFASSTDLPLFIKDATEGED